MGEPRVERQYYDVDGNPVTLLQLVCREPEWAASRIRVAERLPDSLAALKIALADAVMAQDELYEAHRRNERRDEMWTASRDVVLAAITLLAWLTWAIWPGAGIGVTWTTSPDGPRSFRVRRRSIVPRLLCSDATTLLGVIHVAGPAISPYLLAHEAGHALRAHAAPVRYVIRYLLSGTFRRAEEDACHQFGLEWMDHGWIVRMSQRLSGGASAGTSS